MVIPADNSFYKNVIGREVLGLDDFTEAEIEAVQRTEPSKEAEVFNGELGVGARL